MQKLKRALCSASPNKAAEGSGLCLGLFSAALAHLGTNEVLNSQELSLPTLVYPRYLVLVPISQQKGFTQEDECGHERERLNQGALCTGGW